MKMWFLGSSDGLAFIGVKALIFIREKVFTCLELEWYHPLFDKGGWGLDMRCCLIGDLCVLIVSVTFSGTRSHL